MNCNKRIPYGSETNYFFIDDEKCPECKVEWGELHKEGCDQEQCPLCGGQYISCGCLSTSNVIHFPISKHKDEPPIKPACLQITFFECHPRQSYIEALQDAIRNIESSMLAGFEADPE